MERNYESLRALMYSRRITVEELANMSDMSYHSLNRKINKKLRFNEEDICKICIALRIMPCEYFFGGSLQKKKLYRNGGTGE